MAGALGSCLLLLGQERVPLGLELGWDPGDQPPFPSAAPGVTAQGKQPAGAPGSNSVQASCASQKYWFERC